MFRSRPCAPRQPAHRGGPYRGAAALPDLPGVPWGAPSDPNRSSPCATCSPTTPTGRPSASAACRCRWRPRPRSPGATSASASRTTSISTAACWRPTSSSSNAPWASSSAWAATSWVRRKPAEVGSFETALMETAAARPPSPRERRRGTARRSPPCRPGSPRSASWPWRCRAARTAWRGASSRGGQPPDTPDRHGPTGPRGSITLTRLPPELPPPCRPGTWADGRGRGVRTPPRAGSRRRPARVSTARPRGVLHDQPRSRFPAQRPADHLAR